MGGSATGNAALHDTVDMVSRPDSVDDSSSSILLATVVNPAGLTLAKTVTPDRVPAFASVGLGASPSWHAFAIDQTGIAFSDEVGVVGDQRIRIDLDARVDVDPTLSWAPGEFFTLTGDPVPQCARGTLRRVVAELADVGLRATVGHELEFVLVALDGTPLPSAPWTPYGAAGLLEYEGFVRDVLASCRAAGIVVEQLHPEHARWQFEVSLGPADPVTAADQLVLTRVLIGRLAREHGLRASFSPKPFVDEAGCGAHQHVSFHRDDRPLLSGGTGVAGMTPDGEHAVAGILDAVLELQGVLCGSVVSGLRMLPGQWAGAHVCWGVENREAAIRLVRADTEGDTSAVAAQADTPGMRGRGANVEVKITDPSANVYFATAAILGVAAAGIERKATLPPEVGVDPGTRPAGERTLLSTEQSDVVDRMEVSPLLRGILGDPAVDALVAVRRYEVVHFPDHTPEALTERFRLAWSV
ncbi:L-glutamine synthetase [Gordonia westfalica]|uniref:L-glutamine synthetase n=2 Tax=Gordonia westfalica TaxID=158898 RepID=A0A1H2IK27_9ACTN|nr:L-glutamine synthetase [Gordonia westfalica]